LNAKPPAERGTFSGPEPWMLASSFSIQILATRCAVAHLPPVIRSLKTPNVFGPPGSNG
jgi:hypothetical protein